MHSTLSFMATRLMMAILLQNIYMQQKKGDKIGNMKVRLESRLKWNCRTTNASPSKVTRVFATNDNASTASGMVTLPLKLAPCTKATRTSKANHNIFLFHFLQQQLLLFFFFFFFFCFYKNKNKILSTLTQSESVHCSRALQWKSGNRLYPGKTSHSHTNKPTTLLSNIYRV